MDEALGIIFSLFGWIPFLVSLAAQIFCIVHALRTGRGWYWFFIIFFFPMVGCIIYFFVEILPDIQAGRGWMAAGAGGLFKGMQQRKRIGHLQQKLMMTDTLDTRIKLGDEYLRAERWDEAVQVLEPAYAGIGRDDGEVQWGLARGYFGAGDAVKALAILESIDPKHLEMRQQEAALLRARCYEVTGNDEQAREYYEQAIKGFPGEEARVRYGLYLKERGETERANDLFAQTLQQVKASPAFYGKRQRKWVRLAKSNRA